MLKMKKRSLIAMLLILVGAGGIAYAGYRIYSNIVYVHVSTYFLTLEPATNQTITRFNNITFTATLTKDGALINNALIELRVKGALVATNYTLANGKCELTYNVTDPEGSVLDVQAQYWVP